MSGRPRSRHNRNLPDYLYLDAESGVYRLVLTTGKRRSVGKDRATAIAIAREYNNIMRAESAVSIKHLIAESGGIAGEAEPFNKHADKLLERAIMEEQPAADTKSVWLNDIERVKEFFIMPSCDIELEHVNKYLHTYHAESSANVRNRKVSFLKKLFSYAMDESLMLDNPAERKKMSRTEKKVRRRLSLDDFKLIYPEAELWLQTAMDVAMQTTQARLEVSRIMYSMKHPREGRCGCVWLDEPVHGIYGTLYIHRQKVQHKEASHIAIPIGARLKRIIDRSRDNVASPFVVHRLPIKSSNGISKEVSHPTQVSPDYISRAFSEVRDRVGVGAQYPPNERPTFHEIRALAAHLFECAGVDPQARMAHSDAKSTQIYTQNHIDWVAVPHAEILTG